MISVNDQKIGWHPGMTAGDALREAGLEFPHLVLSIDGAVVPNNEIEDRALEDGASVNVMLIAHGG
ncbi:MAG: hypothetical protein A2583_14960 [Bdellovibrionales bacterium RIFOXYD1_FULL_53_11]|nr:MAG: hypothetical protein A2583_14960 [Bdellovibrionales bacterium RIFOXYD1_FULL_53_11]